MKVVVLNASARHDGNSATMSAEVARGAREAGHDVETLFLTDFVNGFLGDCRTCRDADGRCTIEDGYETILLDHVLPADAIVIATPLHYYGMTGRLKAFFDRLFCYTSANAPGGEENLARLPGKRIALVVSLEEAYQGATLGLVAQMQELTRYNRQALVGVVVGLGNSRGEVVYDPGKPLLRCYEMGLRLFDVHFSDYRLDTPRSNKVWQEDGTPVTPTRFN